MISSGMESRYEETDISSMPPCALQQNESEQMRMTLRWGSSNVTFIFFPNEWSIGDLDRPRRGQLIYWWRQLRTLD
jgi:hypothetical protein